VVQVELDTGAAARRLRTQISELYAQTPDIHVVAAGAPGPGSRPKLIIIVVTCGFGGGL